MPRIRRLLDRHDIEARFFVPAVVAEIHPEEQRARVAMLEKLVEYIRGHEGVWYATHEQVARHCLESAPAPATA